MDNSVVVYHSMYGLGEIKNGLIVAALYKLTSNLTQ